MQYEAYEKKIQKVASFLALILKHIVLVIAGLLVVVGSIAALMFFKGTVFSVDCPENVAYGEEIHCEGKAFLSSVRFEFRGEGGEWQETPPTFPGDYKVRACAKGSFGSMKYSDELALQVTPADLTVSVLEDKINYGATPTPAGETVGSDRIECTQFAYGEYTSSASGKFTLVSKTDEDEEDDAHIETTPIQPRATAQSDSLPDGVSGSVEITPDKSAIKIFNEDGIDVTEAYVISVEAKEVGIIPREITVTVEDKEKVYDGIQLAWDAYELTEGELLGNDTMMATFYASITEVGKKDNAPLLLIKNENGDEVNFCYDITVIYGTLSVNVRPLHIKSGSESFVYNGFDQFCDDYTIVDGSLIEGHKLTVKDCATIRNVNETSVDNDMLFSITDSEGNLFDHCYSILLEAGKLEVTKRSVSVMGFVSDESFEYDGLTHYYGREYIYEAVSGGGQLYRLGEYGENKAEGWRNVGVYNTADASNVIFNRNGENITDNFEISVSHSATITIKPVTLTVSTSDYLKEYNGSKDYPDWESCVTLEGKLPAYDTVKFEPMSYEDFIDVGIYENKPNVIATHNKENVSENYNIVYGELGSFEVYPRNVTVQMHNAEKIYDDTPLMARTYRAARLLTGHTLTGKIIGSITEVKENGSVSSSLDKESIVVTDSSGKDITYNYSVSIIEGALAIIPRPITITTVSGTHVYDADPFMLHEINDKTYDNLVKGHSLRVEFSQYSSITEIPKGETFGSVLNELDPTQTKIIREKDNKEVQSNYDITYDFGTLILEKREITVASHSNTWEYDGTGHEEKGFDISEGTLVAAHGHKINEAEIISETAIDAGKYENYFYEIIIRNSRGTDVSHNYQVSRVNGTLEITPKNIVVVTDSATKQYDGSPLYAPNATSDGLLSGHEIILEKSKGITNVSESGAENTYGKLVIICDGQNVTKNYKVVDCIYGKLTVTKLPITVTTGSAKRIYNGQPLSSDRGSIYPSVSGAYAQLYGNTQHTGIGEVENRCDTSKTKILDASGKDITSNFTIKGYEWGILNSVDGDVIKIAVHRKTKIYTGSIISVPITDFDLEIITPGNYTINYGGLTVSGLNCGVYTLASLNQLAENYDIRVTSRDASDSGKLYKVIFVTPEGKEDNSYAVMRIAPRAITLTAASATCVYKENAVFTCNDADITKGSLVSGHTIEYVCEGSITCDDRVYEGYTQSNVIISHRILDKFGDDVTGNYDITLQEGSLTLIMDEN
ncbi:MAG: hypothetical protein J6L85_03805 [Clostridia bacterium]|nr:hypothetical protein [Clostridia bacterium]